LEFERNYERKQESIRSTKQVGAKKENKGSSGNETEREGGLKKYKRERKRDRVSAEDGNDKRKKARGGNFVN